MLYIKNFPIRTIYFQACKFSFLGYGSDREVFMAAIHAKMSGKSISLIKLHWVSQYSQYSCPAKT